MTRRVKGWEKALNAVIEKHRALPSKYGISDCWLIANDAVEAVIGVRMFPGVTYTSEMGAAKELRSRGFKTVADAFEEIFEPIPPSLAQRGDIGVVESGGQLCGGFISSVGFVTRNDNEVMILDVLSIKTAYKVGR